MLRAVLGTPAAGAIGVVHAGELPIFDAHLHFSHDAVASLRTLTDLAATVPQLLPDVPCKLGAGAS